ncbi:CHAP domain-containing protein [Leptolyngbya sp. GB1-A1]|uniref:CHAP domain-containing protein n=1 Tax=Leptolyngbya sp. GB1-A1 TaxID=2933908 RepID=UPI003298DE4A
MTHTAAEKRALLAQIAYQEGKVGRQGNEQKAGAEIERYLNVFRAEFNAIACTTKYSDKTIGFDWCCAFVYYCCLQSGFSPPIQPILDRRSTLGFVSLWYEWANFLENQFYCSANRSDFEPKSGDIVLFDRLLEPVALDHIGIVVKRSGEIITAEGNVNNRSGIFHRPFDQHINGYIRLI